MTSPAPLRPGTRFDLDDLRRVLYRPVSDEQADVVQAPLEAGVVVAGAGSGKTATMVARVVWLVARGQVAPDGVLGLTFTTKAAEELAGRVRAALRALRRDGLLPDDQTDLEPTVSTYHSYAARLVRDHALRVGREPTARLITPATSWQLAARAVATYDGALDRDMAESTAVQAVLALSADLSEHLVDPERVLALGGQLRGWADGPGVPAGGREVLACQHAREQLLPIVARYQQAKCDRELLDFGDVVALAAQLARDCPEVRAAERAAFPVVLLDEYQDTGAAQEVLLASLFGDGHPVTAVGDPCQSIYGWRGASSGTLRRFAGRFAATVTSPRHLSTTYRSGGSILQLANAVSSELREHGVPVPALRSAPGREQDGAVVCALLSDVRAEAGWVAGAVRDAVLALPSALAPARPGDPRPARLGDPLPARSSGGDLAGEPPRLWAQAAVLCRKRSMFPALRSAFDALGIPVEVVGLGGLLDVPEVADLVATLRVLDDPTADAALLRLVTGPRWRIGPRDLAALGRRARTLVRARRPDTADPVQAVVLGVDDGQAGSLVDALDDLPTEGLSEPGRRRLVTLRDELRALRLRLDQPLPELVADVERTLGLDVEVVARVDAPGPAEARADLDAFADAAAQFAGDAAQDGTGEAVLSAFLAYLCAAQDEENGLDTGAASAADTVKLMTVHAAKGLEWPVVAVPGLATSATGGSHVFPGRPRGTSWLKQPRLLPFPLRGDAADLPVLTGLDKASLTSFSRALAVRDAAEERRLAYVAFTRAEHLLLCSGYHWGEGVKSLGPSDYLLQAREACLAGAGRVAEWVAQCPDRPEPVDQEAAATWPCPAPPAGQRVQAVADRVRSLLAGAEPGPVPASAAGVVARWDEDLRHLADEAARRHARHGSVVLPAHLSVTRLVELRRDPAALARALQRPLPRRPSPTSRRGTAFHVWLEHTVFGTPQLLDPWELPGSADAALQDVALAELQEAFQASSWWGRTPYEIEVPFEMEIEDVLIRGRMDAVYPTGDGFEVVDWKTGQQPFGADAQAAAVQLACYRLAWSQLADVPLASVQAAFHYVRNDVTIRPVDLLDADGLRALVRSVPQGQPVR